MSRFATDTDLRAALEQLLGRSIAALTRRPSRYRTGFALEELAVTFVDGGDLRLMFKDLSRAALLDEVRRVKPSFLYAPQREIDAYRLLTATGLGTPECCGAVVDAERERFWLFLEKISGVELYQVGDLETWEHAARWLARLHARFTGPAPPSIRGLIRYDGPFLRLWLSRAHGQLAELGGRLADGYDAVVERLLAQPQTLLHGEFYASNVLVARTAHGHTRVAPVDWEMTGWGPGAVDLAALSTGRWEEEQRRRLAVAYLDELRAFGVPAPAESDFFELVDACRIHISLQWLGWSTDWIPPREHDHDWAGEALAAAARLGLA